MNRRKFLWTGAIFVPAVNSIAQASLRSPAFVGGLNKPSSGSSETLWQQSTSDNDYWDTTNAGLAQRIKNSESKSVTRIECKIQWTSDTELYLKLTENNDGSGTQYGSDSSHVLVTSAGYGTAGWAEFTFSSPASVTSNFWIHMVRTAPGNAKWRMDYLHINGSSYYPYIDATEDSAYCAWNGSGNQTRDDFCFKIYTQ